MTSPNQVATPDPKHCVLGMPGYDGIHPGAASAFERLATRGTVAEVPVVVSRHKEFNSLLAANFNALWSFALTLQKRGKPVDYFAMLHSDIEPEPFWLDKLIAELERTGLDVLSAVVPIKNNRGITSTAVADPSFADPFTRHCRLTMSEVYRLPETFTSDDIPGALLLNTGCWVCRFDPAWAEQVHFTINDRIRWNEDKQCFQAQVEPEDWFFSRRCHELGLKIGATRKVKLAHAGVTRYSNGHVWGTDEFDSDLLDAPLIPPIAEGEFQFPHDIDGWLLPEEGRALYELAKGKRVLEIGSYCGRSTACLAQSAEHVTAVDTWDGRGTPRPRNTLPEFRGNMARLGFDERIDCLETWPPYGAYDLVFIDGAHDLDSVKDDIASASRLLADEGLLAFHDYRTAAGEHDGRWDPGVTQAVDELIADGGELISRHKTIAVVRPPVEVLSA